MSRIIVKKLPRYISEQRFRDIFSAQGDITDSKLIYTKEGNFRGFGFVGYRRPEDAQSAVEHFDKSYLDTTKLQVEHAKLPGDQSLPRPWSRHAPGSSAFKKSQQQPDESQDDEEEGDRPEKGKKKEKKKKQTIATLLKDKVGVDEDDPAFQEFQALYNRGEKNKTWANDALVPDERKKKRAHQPDMSEGSSDSDSDMQRSAHMDDSSGEEEEDTTVSAKPANDAAMSSKSDLEYLRSKMTRGASTESSDEESSEEDERANARHQVARAADSDSSSSSSSSSSSPLSS
ncbi:probable RNA-binding protein 19 [Sycon ciliatum]|uniref:probable RNA-binding protein 19 n=1 Tax=Sycon ciliatum TaxID=27933 RepID=UPI0020ABBC6B|eukprot:scpid82020/ scgid16468/ Probable RNA-binding protein 19; RNA-binding motif protein 19